MIYTIEQFHADHYREIACARSIQAARAVLADALDKSPELPCRIAQKPESESAVWRGWQLELVNRKLWIAARRRCRIADKVKTHAGTRKRK